MLCDLGGKVAFLSLSVGAACSRGLPACWGHFGAGSEAEAAEPRPGHPTPYLQHLLSKHTVHPSCCKGGNQDRSHDQL